MHADLRNTPTLSRSNRQLCARQPGVFMTQEDVGMKISRGFALASLMTLAASPVFAQFSLGDAANAIAGMKGENAATDAAPTPETADLLGALSQLNITPQQAVGGTGAMLGLAKNQLSSTDYSELAKSVPGIDILSGGG
jgi:hypothetical protein